MAEIYTKREIEAMASQLLAIGLNPNVVRRRLSEKGIHWEFSYLRHQGLRERLKRLRKSGLGLCSECHKNSYPLGAAINVCRDCLERKWQTP